MSTWHRNFVLVWTNNFITAVGMMAFLPLFPLYLQEVGVTDPKAVRVWSGILVAGAPLTAVFMGPIWGAIGDRVGRKVMMVRANLAIVLFVGLMSLARAPEVLLLLRLAQGLFSGFVAPSLTLVSVTTPEARQGRVAGYLHTAVLAGGTLGPVLGGLISDQFGHSLVFLTCASLSALAMLLTMLFVTEPKHTRAEPRPLSWQMMRDLFRDLAAFLAPGPLRTVLASVFLVRVGAILVEPTLALYVEHIGGFAPEHLARVTGLVAAAMAVATLLFTPFWGPLGERVGTGRLLAICAGGAALLLLAQSLVTSVVMLGALRFLAGAFLAGIVPTAYAVAAERSPVQSRGGAYGLTFSSLGLALALGPLVGGFLAALLGLETIYLVGAAIVGVAFLQILMGVLRELPAAARSGSRV